MNLPESSSASEPPARLRASDADRDQVADRLREALAEGRITPEEHADRIDIVYRAKTYADLEPVLSDLPAGETPRVDLRKEVPLPPPPPQPAGLVAVFSGVERKGRWLVEPAMSVSCVFGGAELDFRQAVLSQREVTLNVTCLFGGVDITVPPGVRVICSPTAVFGGSDLPDDDVFAPDAPVIRITGLVIFGGVSVKRREVGELRLKDRVRQRHRELRRRHREEALERHVEALERHAEVLEHRRRHAEPRAERRRE